jgi:hypothetical protein
MNLPEFDRLEEGLTLAAAIVVAAVLLLIGGGAWLCWLIWGAA